MLPSKFRVSVDSTGGFGLLSAQGQEDSSNRRSGMQMFLSTMDCIPEAAVLNVCLQVSHLLGVQGPIFFSNMSLVHPNDITIKCVLDLTSANA